MRARGRTRPAWWGCKMRPTTALLLTGSNAGATDPQSRAKEKLEALKKRLPAVLRAWFKDNFPFEAGAPFKKKASVALRRARLLGDAKAKPTIHFSAEHEGERAKCPYCLVTVLLTYYDGLWTARQYQWGGGSSTPEQSQVAGQFLLEAIDEAAER
jgi:hypothetical protein